MKFKKLFKVCHSIMHANRVVKISQHNFPPLGLHLNHTPVQIMSVSHTTVQGQGHVLPRVDAMSPISYVFIFYNRLT